MINKARYWCGVLYPENMRDDWQEEIDDFLQLPYAYCVHDMDTDSKSEHRKKHVHLIIVFPNTTTKKHAMSVFEQLAAEGRIALNTIQAVISIRSMYDYLIHDTDGCRKKEKFLYPKSARVIGNNFDIGSYEQISSAEKMDMSRELADLIMLEKFLDFGEFYMFVMSNYTDSYFEILKTNSGFYERLIKSNYQAFYRAKAKAEKEDIKKLLEKDEEKN